MLIQNREVDIFVGSKIGSFKHIKFHSDPTKNTKRMIENLQNIKTLQKEDEITSLAWGNKEQTEILVGRQNRQIQTYSTIENYLNLSIVADYAEGHIVGLGRCNGSVVSALSSGVVNVWHKKKSKRISINTGAPLDRMRCCPDDETLVATGGNENDLKVWKIGEEKAVFEAKNVSNDWLELRSPVWVSDLCFLPNTDGHILATCSRHGFVRLYDTRAQRRPVSNVDFKGLAATCIAPSFSERQVLVGFGRGQLHQVDLRSKGRPDKGYKGSVGAVTDVATHPGGPYVVSVSLDRHLKVHDANTKALLHKQYLTSKLSTLLVQTECNTALRRQPEDQETTDLTLNADDDVGLGEDLIASNDVADEEYEEIFENMETVGEKEKKKKRKRKAEVEEQPEETDEPIDEGDSKDAPHLDDSIKKLLKSTEKKKKKMDEKKKKKKAKSIFHTT